MHESPRPGTQQPPSAPNQGELDSVRAQLRERVAKLELPDNTDPAEAAKLRADLEGLVDRYHASAGQSVEDAVASLRYEFEDRVRDFAQDQRIKALIEEQEREQEAEGKPPKEPGDLADVFDDVVEDDPPPLPGEEPEPAPDTPDTTGAELGTDAPDPAVRLPAPDMPPPAASDAVDAGDPSMDEDVLGAAAVGEAAAALSTERAPGPHRSGPGPRRGARRVGGPRGAAGALRGPRRRRAGHRAGGARRAGHGHVRRRCRSRRRRSRRDGAHPVDTLPDPLGV